MVGAGPQVKVKAGKTGAGHRRVKASLPIAHSTGRKLLLHLLSREKLRHVFLADPANSARSY